MRIKIKTEKPYMYEGDPVGYIQDWINTYLNKDYGCVLVGNEIFIAEIYSTPYKKLNKIGELSIRVLRKMKKIAAGEMVESFNFVLDIPKKCLKT